MMTIKAYIIGLDSKRSAIMPVTFDGVIPDVPKLIKFKDKYFILDQTVPLTYKYIDSFFDLGQILK
jgi:hypothetical protein